VEKFNLSLISSHFVASPDESLTDYVMVWQIKSFWNLPESHWNVQQALMGMLNYINKPVPIAGINRWTPKFYS